MKPRSEVLRTPGISQGFGVPHSWASIKRQGSDPPMYKHILCWRYLKTRYLAFACIISVMLGVATLIVVNSVMNGFSTKLRTLLHSVLSDVVIEGHSMEGFHAPGDKIAKIRRDPYLNEQIGSMAVT